MVRACLTAPGPADLIYAPIDLAVELSEGLVQKGHQVTFYGPEGTRMEARVKTLGLEPLARNSNEYQSLIRDIPRTVHSQPGLWDQYLAIDMFERAAAGEYDVLHFHHAEAALTLARLYPEVPVAYTLHDPVEPWFAQMIEMFKTAKQYCISISDNQRRDAPGLNYVATVYNGINIDKYSFSAQPEDYLFFSGRIVPVKGAKEAVQVALGSGHRLLIAGPTFADHQGYFDEHIKPFLGEQIVYLGSLSREEVIAHYQKAKALLCPIQWQEPFGLTMVEAMSCGTPVIAFDRGSVREVVADGTTGCVVNTPAEMIAAVAKIGDIKRQDCRQHVESKFSIASMAKAYETVFTKIVNQ